MILYTLHGKIISFVFEPRALYKYSQSSKAQKSLFLSRTKEGNEIVYNERECCDGNYL